MATLGFLRTVARWSRRPVLPRLGRVPAHVVFAVVGLAGLSLGIGTAAMAGVTVAPGPEPAMSRFGPVAIHLPDDVGPWSQVPPEDLAPLRSSSALGGAEAEGAWGAVAPEGVVLSIFTARLPEGTGPDVLAALPASDDVALAGRAEHVTGSRLVNGIRELMLVALDVEEDLLLIVGVSGPERAFASGTLVEAFRTLEVEA